MFHLHANPQTHNQLNVVMFVTALIVGRLEEYSHIDDENAWNKFSMMILLISLLNMKPVTEYFTILLILTCVFAFKLGPPSNADRLPVNKIDKRYKANREKSVSRRVKRNTKIFWINKSDSESYHDNWRSVSMV